VPPVDQALPDELSEMPAVERDGERRGIRRLR
jgi:hypothetical protein